MTEKINWVGFTTLSKREISRFLSIFQQTIVPGLVTSVLYIVIFGMTLSNRIATIEGVTFTQFILPGLIMMNVITNSYSNTSSSILQMKLFQQLNDLLIAPLSNTEISIALILGGTVRGIINGILTLFLGMLLVDLPVAHPFYTLLFLILVSLAFSSAGLLLGIFAESWDNIATMVNFFITPLVFLGGVFYSINMLPVFFRTLTLFNPIYYAIHGLRFATLGIQEIPVFISLYAVLLMLILFCGFGIFLFRKGYRIKH